MLNPLQALTLLLVLLATMVMGVFAWQLCFRASDFGGWLPFIVLVAGPGFGWTVRSLFESVRS